MKMLTAKRAAIIFAAFLILLLAGSAVYIATSPDDIPKTSPDTTSGNLNAGGEFASGGEIAYYLKDGDIYSLFGDIPTKILSGGNGPLFATDGGVVYEKGGDLYRSLSDGSAEALLVPGAKNPLIIGRWVFYTEGGQLVKQRIDDGKKSELGLYPDGSYYISATRIFFLENDGFLYTAKTDGSEKSLVAGYKMTEFIIAGNYAVYRNEGGVLCWFPLAQPEARVEHTAAAHYNYIDGKIVYAYNGVITALSMTDMQVLNVAEDAGADSAIYCDEKYIYYTNTSGDFTRVLPDGSERTTF